MSHDFLGHLASGLDPAPGLELLALLGFDWDITVYIFHSFLSVPFVPYATTRLVFAFIRYLPTEGPPRVTDVPVISFAVRCDVGAIPR